LSVARYRLGRGGTSTSALAASGGNPGTVTCTESYGPVLGACTTFNYSSTTGATILSRVSSSLNFANDTAAAAGGVPLGGLYRNGGVIQIRLV
jgi:hypothetical protein